MMLPGVELARRRRLHCHQYEAVTKERTARTTFCDAATTTATSDDPTVVARLRLDGKLRGLAGSRRSAYNSPVQRQVENRRDSTELETSTTYDVSVIINPNSTPRSSRALSRTSSRVDVCAVCLEEVQGMQRVMHLPCCHKYHSDCVLPWLAAHSHCPCCRTRVPSVYLLALRQS